MKNSMHILIAAAALTAGFALIAPQGAQADSYRRSYNSYDNHRSSRYDRYERHDRYSRFDQFDRRVRNTRYVYRYDPYCYDNYVYVTPRVYHPRPRFSGSFCF